MITVEEAKKQLEAMGRIVSLEIVGRKTDDGYMDYTEYLTLLSLNGKPIDWFEIKNQVGKERGQPKELKYPEDFQRYMANSKE